VKLRKNHALLGNSVLFFMVLGVITFMTGCQTALPKPGSDQNALLIVSTRENNKLAYKGDDFAFYYRFTFHDTDKAILVYPGKPLRFYPDFVPGKYRLKNLEVYYLGYDALAKIYDLKGVAFTMKPKCMTILPVAVVITIFHNSEDGKDWQSVDFEELKFKDKAEIFESISKLDNFDLWKPEYSDQE
jgi:hypothetical protein